MLMSDKTMKEIRIIRIIGFAFVRHDSAIQIYLIFRFGISLVLHYL